MRDSTFSVSDPPSPYQKHAFATNIHQKNVIGLYYAHENHRSHIFNSATFHLYSFNSKGNEWTKIFPNPPEDNMFLANNSMEF